MDEGETLDVEGIIIDQLDRLNSVQHRCGSAGVKDAEIIMASDAIATYLGLWLEYFYDQ